MKRKILALGILSFIVVSTILPFLIHGKKYNKIEDSHIQKEIDTVFVEENIDVTVSMPEETTKEVTTDYWENLIHQMNEEVDNIPYDFNDIQQKQQWFLAYKEVIAKYPKELHMITIYEAYNKEDLELLYGVVQAEVGDEYSFIEKVNVVSVMFNRLNSGKYSDLREVLTAPKQFADVVKGKKIDEKTILACEYVFLFGDTTNGCMAFKMSKQNKWYDWTYQFSDACHHFYK